MKRLSCALLAFCLLSQGAQAHRIDEYLQATMLSVEADHVSASMRLIPGVLVAGSVIAAIDTDGDGSLSAREQRAYAERVLDDLSITVDGNRIEPRLIARSFPEPARMRAGLGEIQIRYAAAFAPDRPKHTLILRNHHAAAASVYLVNAELPETDGIRILAQRRDPRQATYELLCRMGGAPRACRLVLPRYAPHRGGNGPPALPVDPAPACAAGRRGRALGTSQGRR